MTEVRHLEKEITFIEGPHIFLDKKIAEIDERIAEINRVLAPWRASFPQHEMYEQDELGALQIRKDVGEGVLRQKSALEKVQKELVLQRQLEVTKSCLLDFQNRLKVLIKTVGAARKEARKNIVIDLMKQKGIEDVKLNKWKHDYLRDYGRDGLDEKKFFEASQLTQLSINLIVERIELLEELENRLNDMPWH